MKKLVLLISGRGSNMQAIVRASREQAWPVKIAAVISNRPDAAGLQFARDSGLEAQAVDHRAFGSRSEFDSALADAIDAHQPDVIALAGFMRVLGEPFVDRFDTRLINIHPSLLPAFAGLNTHRRALEAGVKVHGATVHLVTGDLDSGPILGQAVVPVLADDREDTLAARVLAAEHRIYPAVLRWIVDGRLRLECGGARWVDLAHREPQWLWCG
jgi:phosphoribosylglycinamide formyltransferase 1